MSVLKEAQIDQLVSTTISTALVPIQDEVKVLKEELLELKKIVNSGEVKPLEKAYLTVNEVSAQTGLNRQAIEKHRNKGC